MSENENITSPGVPESESGAAVSAVAAGECPALAKTAAADAPLAEDAAGVPAEEPTEGTEEPEERAPEGYVVSPDGVPVGGTAYRRGNANLLAMVLVSRAVGLSYFWVALIGSIMAFGLMIPFCFKGKERSTIPPPQESFTVRRMLKYLFSNKYLLIYYFAFLFSSGCSVLGSLQVFMSYYVFNDELVVLYTGFITTVPFAVASFGVPYLLKKINKITLYKICMTCNVVFNLLIFFFARGNVGAYMGFSVLTAISGGVTSVLLFMFTPDCAEYGRFKTGIDAKGITFSLQTLMAKATSAIAGSLGLALIGLFGWKTIQANSFAELAAQGVTQPDSAIDGLWIACILVPAIGNLIAVIILQFYRLKDSDVKLMMRCNAGEISREEALSGIKCRL